MNSEDGWAVGDNPKRRFCNRNSTKVLRLPSFDLASTIVAEKQVRNRNHVFQIQLVLDGREYIGVDNAEAADEFEKTRERERAASSQAAKEQIDLTMLGLFQLQAQGISRSVAVGASLYLGTVKTRGLEEADREFFRKEGSRSTPFRYKKNLRSSGLIESLGSEQGD